MIVVARLISPTDYGLAAMALVVAGIAGVVSGFGFETALQQVDRLTEREAESSFWLATGLGSICTLVGLMLSGPAAAFFHRPDLKPLFAVSSVTFVVVALGSTHRALLARGLQFRPLELGTIAGVIAAGGGAIVCAALGGGAWALVLQPVAFAAVTTIAAWAALRWRPAVTIRGAARLRGTSGNVLMSRTLFAVARNADNMIVGRLLGAAPLGMYAFGYSTMLIPASRIVMPLQDVLLPIVAHAQDDRRRVAELWLRSLRAAASLALPLSVALVVLGPDLVHVLVGARWGAAAPVIRVLAIAGLIQGITAGCSRILVARGRSRVVTTYAACWLATSTVAVVIGTGWGIVGVAAAYAAVSVLFGLALLLFVMRELAVGGRAVAHSVRGVAEAAAVMLAVLVFLLMLAHRLDEGVGVRLTFASLVSTVLFVLVTRVRAQEAFADWLGLVRHPKARV